MGNSNRRIEDGGIEEDVPEMYTHSLEALPKNSYARYLKDKPIITPSRWTDQVQLLNVPRATLSKAKLGKAMELHSEFSAYMKGHNQSNEMRQHHEPDLEQLKKHYKEVERLAESD